MLRVSTRARLYVCSGAQSSYKQRLEAVTEAAAAESASAGGTLQRERAAAEAAHERLWGEAQELRAQLQQLERGQGGAYMHAVYRCVFPNFLGLDFLSVLI